MNAALSLAEMAMPEWETARLDAERQWLMQNHQAHLARAGDQPFLAPTTIADLSAAIADHPDYQIIAGATDIGLWLTKEFRDLPGFISVMRVPELQSIAEMPDQVIIPAGVSHADAQSVLAAGFPALDALWRRFGSAQVRASGTVCGNIANGSPIGDLAPAFLALGASLTLRHRETARDLPLDQFFLGYQHQDRKQGEWLEQITLPKLHADERFYAVKISRRFDQDISAVMGAFWFKVEDNIIRKARVGFGGMAAIPSRAHKAETALIGHDLRKPIPGSVLDALGNDFTPISDVRASMTYRQHMARNLMVKAVAAAAENAPNAAMLAEVSDPSHLDRIVGVAE